MIDHETWHSRNREPRPTWRYGEQVVEMRCVDMVNFFESLISWLPWGEDSALRLGATILHMHLHPNARGCPHRCERVTAGYKKGRGEMGGGASHKLFPLSTAVLLGGELP